jgi:cellulose synthase/poly-beta-1,6-N-acetylglucosamine synthase-like glycosyltransferase
MMDVYNILLGLLTLFYFVTLVILKKGLVRLKHEHSTTRKRPAVTVIVPARNEEKNIAACIDAIQQQSYPNKLLQIIIVDDRSTDATAKIVQRYSRDARIKLLQIQPNEIPAELAPKKKAIDLGIHQAKGEIIITTDADCRPGKNWLDSMMRHFEPDVAMVAGLNPYESQTSSKAKQFFSNLLSMDYFAMAAVAASGAGLAYPLSCTGGNLAYRKEVYLKLGGFLNFGHWVSGDDDFFLEQVRDNTRWRIRYATHPDSHVPTAPPDSLHAFVHQRIRYASKCRHYAKPVTAALTLLYVYNLALLTGSIAFWLFPALFSFWLPAFVCKSFAEYVFLKEGQKLFNFPFKFPIFVSTAILHPFYIVVAAFLGQFKSFVWKGECYSARISPARFASDGLK